MFVSHRGIGLCCINSEKQKDVLPSEFWKGKFRAEALEKMYAGAHVKGCQDCYKSESNGLNSMRTFANLYNYLPIKDSPTHLDLDFSNFCNLKCVMCSASRSSEWAKDIGQPVSGISTAMIDDLAEISDNVQRIVIQGGEPTIMPEFDYYFSLLDQKGLTKNIELMMITNATNVNKRFYRLIGKFKKVRLTVSVDAYQYANDYIRWPSNFSNIEKNLLKMSELAPNIEVEIFNTINILSMFNYYEFLGWCKKIEKVFESKGKIFKIVPMKVETPETFSPFCATKNLKDKFIDDVKSFMDENDLNHNTNWKTEMGLIMKRMASAPVNDDALDLLRSTVHNLDKQRNVKIIDYIPNFYHYL